MRSSRPIRVLALALAALWSLVPVAAAVHGAHEAHRYCPEHQAFEHGPAPLPGSAEPAAGSGAAVDAAPPDEVAGEHEACVLCTCQLRAPAPGPALASTDLPARLPAAVALAAQTHAAPIPLLAAAPKISPPLA